MAVNSPRVSRELLQMSVWISCLSARQAIPGCCFHLVSGTYIFSCSLSALQVSVCISLTTAIIKLKTWKYVGVLYVILSSLMKPLGIFPYLSGHLIHVIIIDCQTNRLPGPHTRCSASGIWQYKIMSFILPLLCKRFHNFHVFWVHKMLIYFLQGRTLFYIHPSVYETIIPLCQFPAF